MTAQHSPPRGITFRQLQIFWAVAHAGSLTQAAKHLAMRQPSISQQLSRMEQALGGKLIRFVNKEMRLTPAGQFLLEEAGRILGAVDCATTGVAEFFEGRRGRFVAGALPSLARNLIVPAFARLMAEGNGHCLDIIEMMPAQAIEQLHGRIIDIAVISGYAAATHLRAGLRAVPLVDDAQLLAVSANMSDLTDLELPESELPPQEADMLNRTIRYDFGSEHSARVNMWYDHLLPHSSMVARCRSFESALAFVELGLGTAIVPELAVRQQERPLFEVTLYALPLPHRQTFAIIPEHYTSLPGIRGLIAALKETAGALEPLPGIRAIPVFAVNRLRREVPAAPDLRIGPPQP